MHGPANCIGLFSQQNGSVTWPHKAIAPLLVSLVLFHTKFSSNCQLLACRSLIRPSRSVRPQYGSMAVGTLLPECEHCNPRRSPAPAAERYTSGSGQQYTDILMMVVNFHSAHPELLFEASPKQHSLMHRYRLQGLLSSQQLLFTADDLGTVQFSGEH